MRIVALGALGVITVMLYAWHVRGERIRRARQELASRRAAAAIVRQDPELWPVYRLGNRIDFSDENEVM